jgi:hypothetical protein
MLAGTDKRARPAVAAGQHAARERVQQARPEQRGLAAARRADHAEQRRADEARDQLRDELLAPEKVLGVVGVERGETLVGADDRSPGALTFGGDQPGALVRRAQLDDVSGQLGLERPGLAAACRGPAGCRVDAAGRLAPCPLARRLVHASRDAAARGE